MFRIRRVLDDVLPSDRAAVAQVQEILRTQFTALPPKDIARLPEQLHHPLKYRFRFILFVAEDARGHVQAFALLSHEPALRMARLRFYERFGARPIAGTEYETPLRPEDPYAPYLMYDDLRQHIRLRRDTARAIVRAILEGKYNRVLGVNAAHFLTGLWRGAQPAMDRLPGRQ